MVYEWRCPRCGNSFYSSSAFDEEKWVECPVCGIRVPNPYYEK